ncbi:uncharacterized protein LOC126802944 [Argentina anserina]|uniref:uncharacterized protein LOC126802944 n=1 Tax=Argentina anserina TaxID=57926 RepID=UPI0021761E12|nr:uncharacterized protein LOC126802944 [Potentilla anserina]
MFDNGSQVDLKDKKPEEVYAEHRTSEPLEVEKNVGELSGTSRSRLASIEADVVVETFPLPPITRNTESLDEKVEVRHFALSTEDKGTKEMGLTAGVDSWSLDTVHSMKSLVGDKVALESPLVGNKSSSVNKEALEIDRDLSLESTNRSTLEGSTDPEFKASANDVLISESFEQIEATAGAKTIESLGTKNRNGTSVHDGLSQTKEVLVVEDEVGVPSSAGLQKGSNPTLDRINLESWQRASKKSEKREGKPFWAVFKEYIDAFVKFWSE